MTEAEEFNLLRGNAVDIREAVEKAYKELTRQIRAGVPPKDAVEQVMASFTGEYASIMAAVLGSVIGESMTAESALALRVGDIPLSGRLYDITQDVSATVTNVVREHVSGFVDARKLALDLYEGYGFNPTEPLVLAPGNDALPKYLRDALLRDTATRSAMARAFAKAQTDALKTKALRAAYLELLRALDGIEEGVGADYLDKKLSVAFQEKMRYLANRIAQTEISRAIGNRRAREFMLDTDLQYVQWRMSDSHPEYDICDYFANVDMFGLGKGVYPKAQAPVPPAHPHCRCRLSVRLDLNGKTIKENADAQQEYFGKLSPTQQRLVAGGASKLEQVNAGRDMLAVHNSGIIPAYQVRPVGEIR